MKKHRIGTGSTALFLMCVISACLSPPPAFSASPAPRNDVFIRHTSSAMGGLWYPMASAMNIIWQNNIPGVIPRLMPGTSVENVKLLTTGETELGWCHSIGILDALDKVPPYNDGKDYSKIAHITTISPSAIHVLIHKNSGITSMADLNGKVVAVAMVGTALNGAVEAMLEEEYGITPKTISDAGGTWLNLTHPEALTMLADGQLDCWFTQSAINDFQEIEHAAQILHLPREVVDSFLAKHPTWAAATIPAGTYAILDKDMYTFSSYVILGCPNDVLDEELVYQMTKTMFENIADIHEVSLDARRYLRLEHAAIMADKIPLHPGAERYYREMGVLK